MRELSKTATLDMGSINKILTEYYNYESHDRASNYSSMIITEIDSFYYSWPINSTIDDCEEHKLVLVNNQYLCHVIVKDLDYYLASDWVKENISYEEFNPFYLDVVSIDELYQGSAHGTAVNFYDKRLKCLQSDPYQEFYEHLLQMRKDHISQ